MMNYFSWIISFFLSINFLVAQSTNAHLIPKKGLVLENQGIKWGNGSELNFFNRDKSKHHYYFTWWEQDIDSTIKNRDILFLGSENTAVSGTYSLSQKKEAIHVDIKAKWNRTDTGIIDLVHAKLWMPFLANAKFESNEGFISNDYLNKFKGNFLRLHTAWGVFEITSSHPFSLVNQSQQTVNEDDYTKRDHFLFLEERNIPIHPGDSLLRFMHIKEINTVPVPVGKVQSLTHNPIFLKESWIPPVMEDHPLVIPKPSRLDYGKDYYVFPEKQEDQLDSLQIKFLELFASKWTSEKKYLPVIQPEKRELGNEEAYQIEVNKEGISLVYQTSAGLQHALYTLLQLTVIKNERPQIPTLFLEDKPITAWRGIHLFTGPTSLNFHKRQFEKILLPFKVNKVVVQCEQAAWKSFPNIQNAISISLKDLKESFDFFRKYEVEPIPLIQSLGHMEWFFKPMENRFMAVNPSYPYTLNPTLPSSKEAVLSIWKEAISLLAPKTIHVGFDEIGMIGFHEPRENEIKYWDIQLRLMDSMAKANKLGLMIWGDMGLSPSECPDACNGLNDVRAKTIRNTIPKGTYVADWHYLNNNDPSVYLPNLKTWLKDGQIPIASTWFYPNNISGFIKAAQQVNAGVLQTTWADFESSEKNMFLNMEQFGAYIMALDYAWSGRTELPEALPYRPIEKWNALYFDQAKPMNILSGPSFSPIKEQKDFQQLKVFADQSILSTGFGIQLSSNIILPEGTPVGEISFLENGKEKKIMLRYGVEIRGEYDFRPIFARIERKEKDVFYCFFDKKATLTHFSVKSIHPLVHFKSQKLHFF
jgi:hypothetical protein